MMEENKTNRIDIKDADKWKDIEWSETEKKLIERCFISLDLLQTYALSKDDEKKQEIFKEAHQKLHYLFLYIKACEIDDQNEK